MRKTRNSKWTKEKCQEEAFKHSTRTDFKKSGGYAYEIARRNNWLDEICGHVSRIRYWTKERCLCEAIKYNTKSDFNNDNQRAYYAASRNNWLHDICSHMISFYWTKEECHALALKYETKKEYETNSRDSYMSAYRHKWLDEICSHMKKMGNKMFRCIYVYEFSDNSAYVGLTYNLQKRNVSRKLQNNDAVTKHINRTNLTPILKQLTEYISMDDASILENEFIEKYKNNGWNVLNGIKGGGIGSSERIWTKEKCQIVALKYNTRTEFYRGSNNVYTAASRYCWLNDICSHMIIKQKHWTVEECRILALKYSARYEFAKNDRRAYTWAIRKNILNEICAHMINKNT